MRGIVLFALRRASATLLAGLILLGVSGYLALNLNRELIPDIDLPFLTLTVEYPGAGPEEVEREVARPLEQALAQMPGLRSLQSVSAEGVAVLILQFGFGQDMAQAEETALRRVGRVALPEGARSPRTSRLNINQTFPAVHLAFIPQDGDLAGLEARLRQDLVPQLERIPGVARVQIVGGTRQVVRVLLDPDRLMALGVPAGQVVSVLREAGARAPAGIAPTGLGLLPLRVEGPAPTLEALRALPVGETRGPDGSPRPVRLEEVARVEVVQEPSGGISRTNGRPSLGLLVTKAQGGNTVSVVREVRQRAERFLEGLGRPVEMAVISNQAQPIEEALAGLGREAVLGAVLAVVAIWLFLWSLRTALVIAVSIPLSLGLALTALYFQNYTLNLLTLGGLSIAVGRLVDDSIVVLENIFRHRQEGEPIGRAVVEGTREVGGAILGATLTTIAVFLPLGFTGGIAGVLFRPFALTVTYALLASLVVSLTVVPVLARLVLARAPVRPAGAGFLVRLYLPSLRLALRFRWLTLLGALVLFVGSLFLIRFIPTTFLPSSNQRALIVSISPGPGMPLTGAFQDLVAQVEERVAQLGPLSYSTTITMGGGPDAFAVGRALRGEGTQGATIWVNLPPEADEGEALARLQTLLEPLQGTATITARQVASGDVSRELQITLLGEDPTVVREWAQRALEALRGVEGVAELSSSAVREVPSAVLRVDEETALRAGVDPQSLAQEVRLLLTGEQVVQTQVGGQGVPVEARLDPQALRDPQALLRVPVGRAQAVPLGQVARVEMAQSPLLVVRQDGRASATLYGTLVGEDTGRIRRDVERALEGLGLPEGVEVRYGGVLQEFGEGFRSLNWAILAGVAIVYLVMVAVMGSLRAPFVILFSVPLASIGALAGLALTGRALSLSGMFGFLMLVGIVVSNGIVLIDFVEQLRAQGLPVRTALLEGARLRLRPVLMTAFTTILALVPVALGFAEGTIIAAELATVVIGGLLTSTFLTLVVVPVVYSLLAGRPPAPALEEARPAVGPAQVKGAEEPGEEGRA